MYCKNCGQEIENEATFCMFCGCQNINNKSVSKKKRDKKGNRVLPILLLLVVLSGIICGVLYFGDNIRCYINLQLAQKAYRAEEYTGALRYYKSALEIDDSLTGVYIKIADIYVEEEEYKDALKILEDGIKCVKSSDRGELEENLSNICEEYIEILLADNKYEKALKIFEDYEEYLDEDLLEDKILPKVPVAAETPAAVAEAPAAVEEAPVAVEEAPAAVEYVMNDEEIYIYSWNSEVQERLCYVFDKYPQLEDRVIFVNVGDSSIYQDRLDILLQSPYAEDYPDIFAVESEYIMKYTNSDYTLSMDELGITKADLVDMYQYTIQVSTDQRDGSLKGLAWQACPGAYMYRRSLAEKYLGTSDPTEVQEYVKDWDAFIETAKLIDMRSQGRTKMLSSNDEIINCFSNSYNNAWVNSYNELIYNEKSDKLLDVYFALEQNDLTDKAYMWSEEWNNAFSTDNVFSYFGCTWFLQWTLKYNCGGYSVGEGTYGDWAICPGPEDYYWGGTWLCVSKECSDPVAAGMILKALCCDKSNLQRMAEETLDYVNNREAMMNLSNMSCWDDDLVQGQDYIKVFSSVAERIDVSGMTKYDYQIEQFFSAQAQRYANGEKSKDKAIDDFQRDVISYFPEISIE